MIERILEPHVVPLVHDLSVRRALPRGGRGVGPFIFLDHMGVWNYEPGKSIDIAPHPHIGLSTLTYLFEGELLHRDSLQTKQLIQPGDVNWMTAGGGVAHSERMSPRLANTPHRIHGLQAWVALPAEQEDRPASFTHHPRASLPEFSIGAIQYKLIAGEAFGRKSPVETFSPLFYLDVRLGADSKLVFDPARQECAFYLISGSISVGGNEIASPQLIIFKTGAKVEFDAKSGTHGVLLGGESVGPRKIWWNFVATTQDRIENAKALWREQKFPRIPEETEFIPLPPETPITPKGDSPHAKS
ncbi:MAG: pirin family protein [Oligoflexia bacterium]|nr:pirin family protein [Oligoflexia bacterium]